MKSSTLGYFSVASLIVSCSPPSPAPPPSSSPSLARDSGSAASAPGLSVVEARLYMLSLINRDRASQGVVALSLDTGSAEQAAQRHAEDMARNGFLGHVGTDGSIPEQRHTEAGGADLVLENAACYDDLKKRDLDPDARIDPKVLREIQSMFWDEAPPHDGHRKNLLRPRHTRVGIGIAQARATPNEVPVPCITQELVTGHGTYVALPIRGKGGDRVRVEGTLAGDATPWAVGMTRLGPPRHRNPKEANLARVHAIPAPERTYWPPPYKSLVPMRVRGNHFSIEVPLGSDKEADALFAISVFARFPGSDEPVLVSLRTIVTHP